MSAGQPQPEMVKPYSHLAEAVPLETRLEQARKKEENCYEQLKIAQLNQVSDKKHEYFTETALAKLNELDKYEEKFKKLLDDPIIIDPSEPSDKMIIFKGISRSTSDQIVESTGIDEIGFKIIRFYSEMKDPKRNFKISGKTETTLRDLFENFRMFLNNQFTIPRPTKDQIDATQKVVDEARANYQKAQDKVKRLKQQTG